MVVLLIGFGLLCGCTGWAFWLLMSDGYMRSELRKTLSREVRLWWRGVSCYRVTLQVIRRPSPPKAKVIRYEQFHHRRARG